MLGARPDAGRDRQLQRTLAGSEEALCIEETLRGQPEPRIGPAKVGSQRLGFIDQPQGLLDSGRLITRPSRWSITHGEPSSRIPRGQEIATDTPNHCRVVAVMKPHKLEDFSEGMFVLAHVTEKVRF